jgi:hypothetical protein
MDQLRVKGDEGEGKDQTDLEQLRTRKGKDGDTNELGHGDAREDLSRIQDDPVSFILQARWRKRRKTKTPQDLLTEAPTSTNADQALSSLSFFANG